MYETYGYGATQRKTNWWVVLGGVVLVACGIALFAAPEFFLNFLTVWAGIGFLISGVAGIASYFQWRRLMPGAGFNLFMAVLDIVVGVLLIVHPLAFSEVIPWMLGIFFIAFGILEIVGMMPFASFIPETRVIAVLSGVLTILVGVMFFVWPASLSIWIAAFALVRGVSMVAAGFTARA